MSEATQTVPDAMNALCERIRAADRASSIPLLTTGAVLLAGSPLQVTESSGPHGLLWLAAGPLTLALIAVFYRRQGRRQELETDRTSLIRENMIVVGLGFLLSAALGFQLGLAAVLIGIAVIQRNTYLLCCAVGLTVLLVLESLYFFDNRLYDLADRLGLFRSKSGYFSAAPAIVYAAFGLLLLTAGFIALTKERRPSR